MPIIPLQSLDFAETEIFYKLTEAQLRQRGDKGLFIAESPNVIMRAVEAGYVPEALLCEEKCFKGEVKGIAESSPNLPVYTGSRETLSHITGYALTRGVLCAFRRQPERDWREVVAEASRVLVIDHVVDTANIGVMFRTAAALGFDAVLLTRQSCDPLNRRSVRTSMGTVFMVPWAWIDQPLNALKGAGFTTVALALRQNSIAVDSPLLTCCPRLALIMGNEGDGLSDTVIEEADYTVMIPMAHGVDSLNVGAAAAIAMWSTRKRE